MFDQVLLLSHGTALWMGPPSRAASDLLNAGLPCAPGVNVADCLLDAACVPESAAQLAAVPSDGSRGAAVAKHARQASDTDSMESGRSPGGDDRAVRPRTRVSSDVCIRAWSLSSRVDSPFSHFSSHLISSILLCFIFLSR